MAVGDEDRAAAVSTLARIAFLRDVARVQRQHKKYLDNTEERLLPIGLRPSETRRSIKDLRASLKSHGAPKRERLRRFVAAYITNLLAVEIHYARVDVGGKPKAERTKRGNRWHHHVNVGYMWKWHVYERFYRKLPKDFGPYLILSAMQVRSTARGFDLFEATAYHSDKGEVVKGFIARSNTTEKPYPAFALKAHLAVSKCEALISEALDDLLIKEQSA